MAIVLQVFRFIPLLFVKCLRYGIYPMDVKILGDYQKSDWNQTRLLMILNHTSLAEYLYGAALPISLLWRMAGRLTFPVAAETMALPIVGTLFRSMAPHAVPISRKRDASWQQFKAGIEDESIVIILPEGRMMRKNGLDKYGKPMTVRRGVAELLPAFCGEKFLIAYSGGLHHILPPGAFFPRLFRRLSVNLEFVDTDRYLEEMQYEEGPDSFADRVKQDLEERCRRNKPAILRTFFAGSSSFVLGATVVSALAGWGCLSNLSPMLGSLNLCYC